jgi:hypothetical protein
VKPVEVLQVCKKEKEPGKGYPVYCASGPERCSPVLFLGWYSLNEPVRCPICGRYTIAIIPGNKFKKGAGP